MIGRKLTEEEKAAIKTIEKNLKAYDMALKVMVLANRDVKTFNIISIVVFNTDFNETIGHFSITHHWDEDYDRPYRLYRISWVEADTAPQQLEILRSLTTTLNAIK